MSNVLKRFHTRFMIQKSKFSAVVVCFYSLTINTRIQFNFRRLLAYLLWSMTRRIIETNGNIPPLTYKTFVTVMGVIGEPAEPEDDPDYKNVELPVPDNFEEKYALSSLKELGMRDFAVSLVGSFVSSAM